LGQFVVSYIKKPVARRETQHGFSKLSCVSLRYAHPWKGNLVDKSLKSGDVRQHGPRQ